jgi:hypothetical protein
VQDGIPQTDITGGKDFMVEKEEWVTNTTAMRQRLKDEKAARLRYQFGKMVERNELPEVEAVDALRASDEHARALIRGEQASDMSFAQIEKLREVCTKHAVPQDIAQAYGLEPGSTYDDLLAETYEETWHQDKPQSLGWAGVSDEEFRAKSEEFREQYNRAVAGAEEREGGEGSVQ